MVFIVHPAWVRSAALRPMLVALVSDHCEVYVAERLDVEPEPLPQWLAREGIALLQ